MLILSIQFIPSDLLDFINKNSPENAPDFFLIDIQPDQVRRFKAILNQTSAAEITGLIPIIRSRLYSVAGKRVNQMKFGNDRTKRFFNREFVLTYTTDLPEENIIIEGTRWESLRKNISEYP